MDRNCLSDKSLAQLLECRQIINRVIDDHYFRISELEDKRDELDKEIYAHEDAAMALIGSKW